MDVFGTIATAIDLGQRIKYTFDQAKQNGADGVTLSGQILQSLDRIRELAVKHSLVNSPGLRDNLEEFERELQLILSRRQRLARIKGETWWDRCTMKYKKLYHVDDDKSGLDELRQRIQTCHQQLQTYCTIRIEGAVADAQEQLLAIREEQRVVCETIQQQVAGIERLLKLSPAQRSSLGLIEEKLDERITQAENDVAQAQDIVGIDDGMDVLDASQTLKDTKEALRRGDSVSSTEAKYLQLKMKALMEVLPTLRGKPMSSSDGGTSVSGQTRSSRWTAYFPQFATESGTKEDSVQQMLRIIQLLKSKREIPFTQAALDLDCLAVTLSDVGMWEEAVQISEWAIQIHSELAESGEADLLADFARSLHNHSAWLWKLGRDDDAIKASGRSVDICRQLAKDEPTIFLPSLAMSLNNLSACQNKAGYYQDAVKSSKEAVKIYRKLSRDEPSQFVHHVATSLNSLSTCLGDAGSIEDAVKASKECVGIYRHLVENQQVEFLPSLASSLTNLSGYLSGCERYREALKLSEEAVAIHRLLLHDQQTQLLPNLASSLRNLAYILGRMRNYKYALRVTEEYVTVLRRLAMDNSPHSLLDLADGLNGSAGYSYKLSHYRDALPKVEEALRLLSNCGQSVGKSLCQEKMVRYLDNQSSCLSHLGRHEEAVSIGMESLDILHSLHREQPTSFTTLVPEVLFNHSQVLYHAGDYFKAEDIAQSSIRFYRALVCNSPSKYDSRLEKVQEHLSDIVAALEREEEAERALEDESLL